MSDVVSRWAQMVAPPVDRGLLQTDSPLREPGNTVVSDWREEAGVWKEAGSGTAVTLRGAAETEPEVSGCAFCSSASAAGCSLLRIQGVHRLRLVLRGIQGVSPVFLKNSIFDILIPKPSFLLNLSTDKFHNSFYRSHKF